MKYDISNCYEKCDNYYYFDGNNIFHCTKTCPEQYKCFLSCPDGTFYNSSNKLCQIDKKIEIKTTSEVKCNKTVKDERDEDIQNFRNNVYDYNISKSKVDKI